MTQPKNGVAKNSGRNKESGKREDENMRTEEEKSSPEPTEARRHGSQFSTQLWIPRPVKTHFILALLHF